MLRKILKTFFKSLFALLILILIGGGILGAYVGFGSMKAYEDDGYKAGDLADWMACVDDDALIKNLAIPGSHDAGSEGMFYMACTQKLSVADQLDRGVRYFDLRVTFDNGTLKIFHSSVVGASYETVAESFASFLSMHPSEGLILDFQYFKNDAHREAMRVLEEAMGEEAFIVRPALDPVSYVDGLSMKDLRGKCLVTVGLPENELYKNFEFVRDKDSDPRDGSVLHSPYDAALNKLDSARYIDYALPIYYGKYEEAGKKGLFVLQGQLTDGWYVFGPAFGEGTHRDNMDAFVKNLAYDREKLDLTNVVMRDFVNAKGTALTISLNFAKGTVSSSDAAGKSLLTTVGAYAG